MVQINDVNVFVKNGNVATEKVDCIVVPEFDTCASYGGVGYAIEAAGMAEGLEAYDKEAYKAPFTFGDVLITKSGRTGVKLAHLVTAGAKAEEQFSVVAKAVFNLLVAAKEQGVKTIALPEIGTGIIGSLTQEQSAKAMFGAIHQFTAQYPASGVEVVTLVIYRASTQPAEKVLTDGSYVNPSFEKGGKSFNMADWLIGMGLMG